MTYNDYVSEIALLMGTTTADTNYQSNIPSMINYAELRIYRELDFLTTVTTNSAGQFTANLRSFTFPVEFVTSQGINVITPATQSDPDQGTRSQLTPTTKEFLDAVYPSLTGATLPEYYAMLNDQEIIVGPWPDQTYTVEVIGTIRPAPLSQSNATTYLTDYFPDLFIAASMVFASGYMKNYGASNVDDPQQPTSWEKQYQNLKSGATEEEFRKKYMARAWSSQTPSPTATPSA